MVSGKGGRIGKRSIRGGGGSRERLLRHLHTSILTQCAFDFLPIPSSIAQLPTATPAFLVAMVGYALAASLPFMKPMWLHALLAEKFFVVCPKHGAFKKNERNIYCVDCSLGICHHCLSHHSPHRLLQIRRYVYHDVIRLQDIQKLIDCALVQTYIINSARVVFLNQRPQPRPSKGLGNTCETCDRSLQDAYRFCSVACKVDVMFKHGKDVRISLPRCNSLHVSDLASCSAAESLKGELECDDQLSPPSVMEAAWSPTSSGSTANDGIIWGEAAAMPPPNSAKSDETTSPRSVISLPFKRRKGRPRRSPFC